METVTFKNTPSYRRVIMQHGRGLDRDGYYVYNQEGEGIGSFFSSLLRGAVPILAPLAKEAIKGLSKKAISHIDKKSRLRGTPVKRKRVSVKTYPKRARL